MKNLLFKVILPILGIAGILAAITVLSPIRQSQAQWLNSGTIQVSCGSIVLDIIPNSETSCSTNQYQTSVKVIADSGAGAFQLHWKWGSYFCSDNNSSDQGEHCYDLSHYQERTDSNEQERGITGNGKAFVVAYSPVQSSVGFAGACGHFQNDFSFYLTPNDNPNDIVCSSPNLRLGQTGGAWDHPGLYSQTNATTCNTDTTCTVPQPTATPTPVCNNNVFNQCEQGSHQMFTVTTDCHGNVLSNQPIGFSATCGATCEELGNCAPTATPTPQPTATPTPTNGPTATPTPTGQPTATPTPTGTPTPTPTSVNIANCNHIVQVANNGSNNNANCNQQTQSQTQSQSQSQNNGQTINNNANNSNTVNITLNGSTTTQPQQVVLAAATAPTTLPSTGTEPEILLGLLALAPIGWKIRKLI